MTVSARQAAIRSITSSAVQARRPEASDRTSLPELFGSNVFDDASQRQRLPKSVYAALRRTIERGEELADPAIADAVATAMRDWAVERGATHYTHWFQPMTGLTAEKHDSFLTPTPDGRALLDFSGNELIKGEPDASSFPSGGLRATFEARGYTGWDPTSPAFLRETAWGSTLMIPTTFASWTGEALDTKTPLMRSCEALKRQAVRMLRLLGEEDVEQVDATVGPEQEFFLVDKEFYYLRPDLVTCGRTLFGKRPPKGQELEDHYFASTPRRVLDYMMDLERELWRLGIPVKTRHAEVAPSQFEMAPIFEKAALAIDHNMLTMELMQVVAERHGLVCLLHEKPFARINGSGKHNNWSLADDKGQNLLDPGHTPHDNLKFVLFLTAIIRSVDLHQDLLRASVATAGNDHRLGANEAPPAIVSIFLGSELEAVVESLTRGTPYTARGGGSHLKLGVTALPPLPRDSSDRNRTSPFAFTGNKFEFRAVGSSQTIAYANIIINTAVAESLDYMSGEIERRSASSGDRTTAMQEVVRDVLTKHQRILFSGDNYTAEWTTEAERRGLLNLRDTPSALASFNSEENIRLFETYEVFSRRETESHARVLHEAYVHRLGVEALSMRNIAATSILPCALVFQKTVADSILSTRSAAPSIDLSDQEALLGEIAETTSRLKLAVDQLTRVRNEADGREEGPPAAAVYYRDRVVPAMSDVRTYADRLESLVDDQLWPLPKYRELLFIH